VLDVEPHHRACRYRPDTRDDRRGLGNRTKRQVARQRLLIDLPAHDA